MDFANAMARKGATKLTENGAMAYNTAGEGALLDFFSQAGALRPREVEDIQRKFAAAYRENPLLATKAMFYTGDIRQGGLGERRTFRACLRWLAKNHPEVVNKNMELIPLFNRFDSWFELVGTTCEKTMWECVAKTLTNDLRLAKENANAPITLLAKWMPSENASSLETKRLARKAMTVMGLRPREYRKMLTKLRNHIKVVEAFMSAGNWDQIDYAKVPSYAMHNYGSAFAKHDHARFDAFLNKVTRGDVKINASVLFPYDLVHKYLTGSCGYGENRVVEAQWKALPNYLTKPVNAVVMADVSGSMYGRPMETSIGLATYFAQHNTGLYHNKYMTFTDHPTFINLVEGASLAENVDTVRRTGIGYSTNLNAAFQEILDTAVFNHVSPAEMPKALVVISDMEIDPYFHQGNEYGYGYGRRDYNLDFVEVQRRKFAAAGYTMPKLVLWNVQARNDTYLSQAKDVILLSGQSASTFKNLCQNLDGVTAYEMMLQILNAKAYQAVRV